MYLSERFYDKQTIHTNGPNGIKTMETNGDVNAKTAKTVPMLPNLDPAIFCY